MILMIPTTCNIVRRSQLLKSCRVCQRLQRDHTIWNFINPETTKAWNDFLKHVRRSHPEALETEPYYADEQSTTATHMESISLVFVKAVREATTKCDTCKTLERKRENTQRERPSGIMGA